MDRIIDRLNLTFVAEKPPPSHVVEQVALMAAEEELNLAPSKGWAAMIRKVYEVDPMLCPKCGGSMKIIAFITDYQAVDRIIDAAVESAKMERWVRV